MEEKQFVINFNFQGQGYVGIVGEGHREHEVTFIVKYTENPERITEKTVEVCVVQSEEPHVIIWGEVTDEVGKIKSPDEFIQAVGEAIEFHGL